MDKADRISVIGSSILAQAEKESRTLIDKANRIREKELAEAEERIISEAGERLQRDSAELRHEYAASIAEKRTHARESLLRRRGELTASLFRSVEEKLLAFAASPGYLQLLLRELREAGEGYDHSATTVFLAERDLIHAGAVKALLPGAVVKPDENIRLGGWKLANQAASILVDHSFEARLRDQRAWFLEHCNLEVV